MEFPSNMGGESEVYIGKISQSMLDNIVNCKWSMSQQNGWLHSLKPTNRPLKIGRRPKGELIFRPSIFRCHASSREGSL